MTTPSHPSLSIDAEIARLTSAESGEPSVWLGPLEIRVRCEAESSTALSRVREVMCAVLTHLSGTHSYEEWRSLLPAWFTAQCVDEVRSDDDLWSLSGWLQWFTEEERTWYWWDSAVLDARTFRIRIVSNGLPFAWGALEWLLRCSGGIQTEQMF